MDTKITIIDTHRSWNEAAAVYLRHCGYVDIVTSLDPLEALELARQRRGVSIAGLRMGKVCGLDWARKLRESDASARVVMSSSFWTPIAAIEAAQVGICGSHCRERDGMEELAMAVRCAERGHHMASPALLVQVIPLLLASGVKLSPLSEREEIVLYGLYMRQPYKELAGWAKVAETTIGRDRTAIAEKLRVDDDEYAIVEAATASGLIDYLARKVGPRIKA